MHFLSFISWPLRPVSAWDVDFITLGCIFTFWGKMAYIALLRMCTSLSSQGWWVLWCVLCAGLHSRLPSVPNFPNLLGDDMLAGNGDSFFKLLPLFYLLAINPLWDPHSSIYGSHVFRRNTINSVPDHCFLYDHFLSFSHPYLSDIYVQASGLCLFCPLNGSHYHWPTHSDPDT